MHLASLYTGRCYFQVRIVRALRTNLLTHKVPCLQIFDSKLYCLWLNNNLVITYLLLNYQLLEYVKFISLSNYRENKQILANEKKSKNLSIMR